MEWCFKKFAHAQFQRSGSGSSLEVVGHSVLVCLGLGLGLGGGGGVDYNVYYCMPARGLLQVNLLSFQMQAENIPLPEEVERALPPDSAQRLRLGSGASILRFLKNNILKPKPPTEIHSGSLGEAERDKTLAPFAMQGVEVGRVNRDYEAFFTSAWGGRRPDASGASNGNLASSAGSPSLLSPPELGDQPGVRPERLMTKQERPVSKPLVPANKPRSKTGGDVLDLKVEREKLSAPAHGPQVPRGNVAHAKRTPLLPPSVQQVSRLAAGRGAGK